MTFNVAQKLAVLVAFAGAPRNVFTITGMVKVVQLYGRISTAISANATAVDLSFTPSGGSPFAIAASTTVTSEPVETYLGVTWDFSDTLTLIDGMIPTLNNGAILGPGTIVHGTTGATATTGAVDWYMLYQSITAGASVRPAA